MKTSPISSSQINDLINVYMNTFNNSNWNEQWEFADTEKRLTDIIATPGFIGLTAFDGNTIVGMVLGNIQRYCKQNHYNLQEMAVIPEFRNKGIGSLLIIELQTILIEKNVNKIYLLTEKDSLSENFYIKNNFFKSQKIQLLGKLL